ncbi:Uncharacterized protein OS=Ruminococcus albus (strain ATCC 27210 / DSM 20455 / JCM 14654 / NCDO 2250 / 7) GN=Rumal_0098 PE=4 SV=1 [Gemmata massiliana]|uniref:Imm33-like domain-containing protein n=1 Tax=Gemmata massiliana TaxID=1210884 RepID=A0A6P2DIS3_9BACT|nr:hypothetical protein [Gemmata massiliana]VTS02004.1 Uncharacterized protein OS=Ruminococcus albus (strain ATCC 27210 / DSM 20455 / JCM 14654 / NCDO 2250 / 7) GN=Rumal_0098 PE=4 SV=1 [Gemmata massiliana]
MSLRVSHAGVTLSTECDEALNGTAQDLFGLVTRHIDRGARLKDGIKVAFGWTEFRVADANGTFVFQEPDFDSDPDSEYRDNLDCSLSGYRRQQLLISALDIGRWEPARFSEVVLAEKGALATSRIVAKRIADTELKSNWLICLETTARGKQEITIERARTSFELIPVWHLFDIRPALFDALALPIGFQALIDDNRIVQVVGNTGEHWSL